MSRPGPSTRAAGLMLSRRQLMTAALGLLAGRLAGGLAVAAAEPALPLLAVLSHPEAAAGIGRAYIAAHPQEADAALLAERIDAAVAARVGQAPSDPEALATALVELVQDDYITATLIRVDGWLLAPTEARLYALAALAR